MYIDTTMLQNQITGKIQFHFNRWKPRGITYQTSRRWVVVDMRYSKLLRLVEYVLRFLLVVYLLVAASYVCRRRESREREMVQAKVEETYYISHGAPTLSIDDSLPARGFLKSFRDTVYGVAQRPRPTSILVISGHWETDYPTVNAVSGTCDTIYDFYGFPQEMYKLKYPTPGAPQLATRVKELLTASGFQRVGVDKKRGLDHGAWVPLMLMFPEADIPVCQLSVQTNRDGTYHYNLGKALAPLKEEGVLIIGSGSATHNLRAPRLSDGSVASWSLEFDTWLKDALLDGRYEDINHYEERAPHAKAAHPWPDHFYPLHVAIGAAGEDAKAELIHHSWQSGTLSYASYKFTTAE